MSLQALRKPDVTQGAEGFARRAFTVKDVLRMQRAGIIRPTERYELVEGEIVPMRPTPHLHELIKIDLFIRMARTLPDDLWMGVATSMYLSDRTILEPDICLYKRGLKLESVKGPDIILAIEVALTTLAFDRGLKAQLYAKYGVQELWVIDAEKRRTFVHKGASAQGWNSVTEHGPRTLLKHAALPGFAVRLAEI